MRTILEAMRELLEPQILQNGPLVLRESDPNSTCPPTKIEQSGGQVVALRFEPRSFRGGTVLPVNEWLFPLFDTKRSHPPVCRSCDYILFYAPKDEKREIFVFPCELKSSSARGAWEQLRNGWLLARYVLEVIKLHGEVDAWPAAISFRGIVFSGNAPRRRGTLKATGGLEWLPDDRTELKMTVERAGGGHHLQTFCV